MMQACSGNGVFKSGNGIDIFASSSLSFFSHQTYLQRPLTRTIEIVDRRSSRFNHSISLYQTLLAQV
ncbi:hypothetical protein QVD17_20948 [Tagetes erecta]|uniref:Uncharacterized protein n=1 Tax=Tagetes erecta TaxID=13708 RepID=A0AAD8KM65_TARER|nr:hypothetical protein QVD17_20948 [Tagetes erecta]